MCLEITFEKLFGHRRDGLSQHACKSASLESHMTAGTNGAQVVLLTSNLMLFDSKGDSE